MSHLVYSWHFLLLSCFAVLLIALTRLQLLYQPVYSFALYGMLHALALMLSLRRRQVLWRQCAFVATAAVLSIMTFGIGAAGGRLVGSLPSGWGLYALLGVSSATGAFTYGLVIRAWWIRNLTLHRLGGISLACMLATLAAFFMLKHFSVFGRWWLAVAWWYAMSAGLLFSEMRPRSRVERSHG